MATAAFALVANSAPVSDISGLKNYFYIPDNTEFSAGQTTTVNICLKQTGLIQGTRFALTLSQGTVKSVTLKKTNIPSFLTDTDDEESKGYLFSQSGMTAAGNEATGATTATGTQEGYFSEDGDYVYYCDATTADKKGLTEYNSIDTKLGYTSNDFVLFTMKVEMPAAPTDELVITFTDCELAFDRTVAVKENALAADGRLSDYCDYDPDKSNYVNPCKDGINNKKTDLSFKFAVAGATGVDSVAADGTEAKAPAKKVVDGQLVIETANGTFNAAGAQVK